MEGLPEHEPGLPALVLVEDAVQVVVLRGGERERLGQDGGASNDSVNLRCISDESVVSMQ